MELNINIDPEKINEAITQAIIQSAIGEKIKASIDKLLSESWRNPIDEVVRAEMVTIIRQQLHGQFAVQLQNGIKEKLGELLTVELLDKIVDRGLESFLKR